MQMWPNCCTFWFNWFFGSSYQFGFQKNQSDCTVNKINSGIFYYVGVMNNIPVVQMLSECHHMPAITYWLEMWLRSGASIPHVAVTNQSKALMSACSRAFTGFSLEVYFQQCFDCLTNLPHIKLLRTSIRVCCSHALRLIASFDCLSKVV